jgi:hypothetical protein
MVRSITDGRTIRASWAHTRRQCICPGFPTSCNHAWSATNRSGQRGQNRIPFIVDAFTTQRFAGPAGVSAGQPADPRGCGVAQGSPPPKRRSGPDRRAAWPAWFSLIISFTCNSAAPRGVSRSRTRDQNRHAAAANSAGAEACSQMVSGCRIGQWRAARQWGLPGTGRALRSTSWRRAAARGLSACSNVAAVVGAEAGHRVAELGDMVIVTARPPPAGHDCRRNAS